LPLVANRRPVYLLGTGESVESPMAFPTGRLLSAKALAFAAFIEAQLHQTGAPDSTG
jgi:hypothetical protein